MRQIKWCFRAKFQHGLVSDITKTRYKGSSTILYGRSMQVQCFTVGNFAVNTYLITDAATGKSAIIDTGETGELRERLKALSPL